MQRFGQKEHMVTESSSVPPLPGARNIFVGADAQSLIDRLYFEKHTANDDLYYELEERYGCVFAQWVVDRLPS